MARGEGVLMQPGLCPAAWQPSGAHQLPGAPADGGAVVTTPLIYPRRPHVRVVSAFFYTKSGLQPRQVCLGILLTTSNERVLATPTCLLVPGACSLLLSSD